MIKKTHLLCLVCSIGIASCKQAITKDERRINNQTHVEESQPVKDGCNRNDSIENIRQQQMQRAIEASENCKTETLIAFRNNINNLTEQQVLSFLEGFNELCAINVEYSEFSNYLLFLLLREQPVLVLKSLAGNKSLPYKYIKKNILNPINDTINLDGVYKSIESVNDYHAMRDSVLTLISVAIEKQR